MTTRIHPPASPPPPDDEQLPCGQLLSQVWSAWEDGLTDDHQRTCPYCRQSIQDLEKVETAVRQLRDETDDAEGTSGFDAAALTQRVMNVVRLELRPGRPLPLGGPEDNMWIMESVAARTLRAAVEQVPGVRAGSCRITPEAPGAGRVSVRLGIHAPLLAPDLPELAESVRRRVKQAADQRLGLDIAGIDIRITDLVDAPDSTEKGLEG